MTTARHRDQRSSDRGFTLVELLVVVIIIGILAAVAVPVFLNQRTKAQDAALRSDLRNAATVLQTYMADGGTWTDLKATVGQSPSITLRLASDGSAAAQWNDFAELPTMTWSDGTVISLYYRGQPQPPYWQRVHPEGDFCLVGKRVNSSWPGTGNGATLLYFDTTLGGIKTIQEIKAAVDAGTEPSCAGSARQWAAAVGG